MIDSTSQYDQDEPRLALAHETSRTHDHADEGVATNAAVDALQDELMVNTSSDGGPPPRAWRLAGWHWVVAMIPVMLLIAATIWVAMTMGIAAAVTGFVVVSVLAAAAVPVWGAGILRGKEERAAHVQARVEVQTQEDLELGTRRNWALHVPQDDAGIARR